MYSLGYLSPLSEVEHERPGILNQLSSRKVFGHDRRLGRRGFFAVFCHVSDSVTPRLQVEDQNLHDLEKNSLSPG